MLVAEVNCCFSWISFRSDVFILFIFFKGEGGEGKREGGGRERDGQTDRQAGRQTDGQTDR